MKIKSTVVFAETGCLLPILILLNLFFGWMFLRPYIWIISEVILILLVLINYFLLAKNIISFSGSLQKKNVIDTEGKVIKEVMRQKL